MNSKKLNKIVLILSKYPTNFLIAVAEGLAKIAIFIIIPVSGLILTTDDFIIWTIIFPSIQILTSAFSFGLPSYILRSYFIDQKENKINNTPVYNSFLILSFFSIFIFIFIKEIYNNNAFIRWDVYFLLITNSFLVLFQQKYQGERNGIKYFIQTLIWRICYALSLILIFASGTRINLSFLLAFLLFIQVFLMLATIYQERISFKFQLNKQKEIFKFGFPIFLIGILQFIMYMNSRYFVYTTSNASETAIFSLIQTFVGALNLLFVIFVRIYIPKLYQVLNKKNPFASLFSFKGVVFSLFEIIVAIIFLTLLIYSFFYSIEFDDNIFIITPILIIGLFFYGIQIFIIDSLVFFNKTFKLFFIKLILTIFSVIIGYFSVKLYGINGAAVGVALTQFLSLIMAIYFTNNLFNKIIGFRFFIKRIFRIIIILSFSIICYFALGKIAVIIYFIILMGVTIRKLNLPVILKQFDIRNKP